MIDKEKDNRYDICPVCGGYKRQPSKTCKACQSQPQNRGWNYEINLELTNEPFWREFSGLFMGEGSAMIVENNSSFSVILSLGLREDDSVLIYHLRQILGGSVLRRKSKIGGYDVLMWRTTNMKHVLEISQKLLEFTSLPAKKVSDVQQVIEFCIWRLPRRGCRLLPEEREEGERRMFALRQSRNP